MSKKLKVLMSGGGTGGHIFPAVAIAQEIQKRFPDAEFLFMGANGKMEMEKVPQAGFKIEGLNIAGFDSGNT
jgi:UDP-N-acetylglucosamine--N-acetylmuramyl-(pentapeptide) pyrophosphoryl-undecaprenol N-acetylglucosamine transferase